MCETQSLDLYPDLEGLISMHKYDLPDRCPSYQLIGPHELTLPGDKQFIMLNGELSVGMSVINSTHFDSAYTIMSKCLNPRADNFRRICLTEDYHAYIVSDTQPGHPLQLRKQAHVKQTADPESGKRN